MEEFSEWLMNLEMQTLTTELKEEIIEQVHNFIQI